MTRHSNIKRTNRHTAPRDPAATGPHDRPTDYPLADTAPRWYTFEQLATATGLTTRQLRHMADEHRIRYQQDQWNGVRRLNHQAVSDLEALGIPVHLDLLGNTGKTGSTGMSPTDTPEEAS